MIDLFFELLQVSIGIRDNLSRTPSEREWEEMYDEAERQAVVGVLLEGLQRCMLHDERCLANLSIDLKLSWIGEVQMMEAEYRRHVKRSGELNLLFKDAGLRSCILKGIGIAQLYPHPERRQCGDIDLWMDGSRKDVITFIKKLDSEAKPKFKDIAFPYKETEVEIHFIPTYLNNFHYNKRLQRFIKENSQQQFDNKIEVGNGLSICTPTDDFNVIFQMSHMYHHFFCEGIGMRHFVDYFYLLKRNDVRCKREGLRCKLREFGMLKFANGVMWVLQEKLGLDDKYLVVEPKEKIGMLILKQIQEYGNFGSKELEGKSKFQIWMSTTFKPIKYLSHFPGASFDRLLFMVWLQGWKILHKE